MSCLCQVSWYILQKSIWRSYTKQSLILNMIVVYKYYMVWEEIVTTIFPFVLATGLPPQTHKVRGGRPVATNKGKIVSLHPQNNHVGFVSYTSYIFMTWWSQFIIVKKLKHFKMFYLPVLFFPHSWIPFLKFNSQLQSVFI